jgi:hypothetical protein
MPLLCDYLFLYKKSLKNIFTLYKKSLKYIFILVSAALLPIYLNAGIADCDAPRA